MANKEDFINQEISTYEVQLNEIEVLKKKVADATQDLTNSYFGIINAKEKFEFVKKQNIEELRLYKFAIKAECDEISKQIINISEISKKFNLKDLENFAKACATLDEFYKNGLFDKFKSIPESK
jgi:hypothetical protein